MFGWIEDHSGTAAWLQAIGTIVALCIAIGIPWFQHRTAKRRGIEIRKRANAGIVALIEQLRSEILQGIEKADKESTAYFEMVDNRQEIDALIEELDRLPPGTVDYALSAEFALFRVAAHRARWIIDGMERDYINERSVGPIGADDEIALASFRNQAESLLAHLQET